MLFEERLLKVIETWMSDSITFTYFEADETGQSSWDNFLQMAEYFFARNRRIPNFYYTNGESPLNTRLIKLDLLKHEVEESIKRQKSIYKDNDGNR